MSLLFTLTFLTLTFGPVMADCNPSNAVVAAVSVVVTLVVVAVILLGILLFLKKRRKTSYLKTRKSARPVGEPRGDMPDGFTNAAFAADDVGLAEQGLSVTSQGSNNNSPSKKKNEGKKEGGDKTWSSFPKHDQTGILYRQGSCGSLDENITHSDPELVSVCLESQDIIGLGFNICGNFGQGILVSQVHNRGPAVESGKIKVGDKILSVTVSYENIVYEDALTILSYASPYPVKVVLQKADTERPRDSVIYKRNHSGSTPEDAPSPDQLNHPLYRSQSLNALKNVQGMKDISNVRLANKRTQSEIKSEGRKDGSRGKKGDRNSKSFVHDVFDKIAGSISSSRSNSHRRSEVVSEVVVHNEVAGTESTSKSVNESVQMSSIPNSPTSQGGSSEMSNSANEFASLMDEMLDLKEETPRRLSFNSDAGAGITDDSSISKPSPPNKPERKSKRQESLEAGMSSEENDNQLPSADSSMSQEESDHLSNNVNAFVSDVITSSKAVVENSSPLHLQRSASEVNEDVIQPSVLKREIKIGDDFESVDLNESSGERSEESNTHDAFDPFSKMQMTDMNFDTERSSSPSPSGIEVEESVIEASIAKKDSSVPVPTEKKAESDNSTFDSSKKEDCKSEETQEEKPKQPVLDEEMLERLIAMNSYAPGTQGWAGIQAGGEQGGIIDDFIPNSNDFMAQPVPKEKVQQKPSVDSRINMESSRPMSPPSVAYEIRDGVVSGKPVAVEINKNKTVAKTISYNSPLINTSSSPSLDNNANKPTSQSESNSSYSRPALSKGSIISNNDSTESQETPLDWSGQRLVRAGSFSDIPQNKSISDWAEIIVKNEDNESCVKVDDLTDSDSGEMDGDSVPQISIHLKDKTLEAEESKPSNDQRSDFSNSASSSSGEATPPYQRNGQELGSSPEFSLPSPALHILSNEISSVGKGNSFSLTLDDSKSHDDVEC